MALSRVQYTGDGTTSSFSLTFPYLAKADIKASLDGTATTFSFVNDSTIAFSTAPAKDVIIDIRRETERENILVDFQDASTLTESDLDKSARQSFYLAQESYDQTGSTMAVANDGSYSANNRRISTVGYPNSDDDAATQKYVKDTLGSNKQYADTATAAATEAENWANTAEDTLVPEGDGIDDYSALHWSRKAESWAASVNIPSAVGNASKILRQKADETGFEYIEQPFSQTQADGRFAKLSGANSFDTMPTIGTAPIVESGSNTDGEWTKWADGTMTGAAFPTISYDTVAFQSFTYPLAFVSTPAVSLGFTTSDGNGYARWAYTNVRGVSTTAYAIVFRLDGNSSTTVAFSETARVSFTGRWK